MPSQLQTETTHPDEILILKHKAPVRNSVQSQDFGIPSEKVSSPGKDSTGRLNVKPTERPAPDQHAGMTGKLGVGNSVTVMPLGNRHKPWPRRKANVDEEVVKYMSSVPSYLQPPEKGDNIQDKALNFGVLDWGRLEKWTYLQKQVVCRKSGDSPSCSSASSLSPFSTSGSSSHSDGNIGSPVDQVKKCPTLVASQSSPSRGRRSRMMEEQHSLAVMMNPNTRTSRDKASIGRNDEKGRTSGSEVKRISFSECPDPEIGSSSCAAKDDNNVKAQTNRSRELREARKSQICEQQTVQANLDLAEKELAYQFSVVENMWESIHDKDISYDSGKNNSSVEVNRNSFSGAFPLSDIQFTRQPPRISYSCPLSSTSQGDPTIASGLPSKNEILTANAKSKLVKLDRFTDDLSEKVVDIADKPGLPKPKARRDLSPQRLIRAGLNRIIGSNPRESLSGQQTQTGGSYHNDSAINGKDRRSSSPQRLLNAGLNLLRNASLREGSMGQKTKETVCSDNSCEENAASIVRSRRSPLRRIFDPLKPKNQIPFPGPVTSLPSHRARGGSDRDKVHIRDELRSANGSYRLSDAVVDRSTNRDTEAGSSVHVEKEVASTRQALLKLAWKNGSPLFVFSSSDINILSATMEKRSIAQNGWECIYTIFTAHEIKKKSGVWASQVNKNKKHGLVYNVVGQLKVSSSMPASDGTKNFSLVREFVLYGGEQVSMAQDRANSPSKEELAALVIHVQSGSLENDNFCPDSSHMLSTEESLQVDQKGENVRLARVVAILPSGVHGMSSTGEPSPLIERWRSGGSCDCGGWDEGCMLTILTDKIQEKSSTSTSEKPYMTNATHQIELFTQGETKATRHAFSMITFKEGVNTVDFGASISSLQAFAMCIATLHSRNSMGAQFFKEQTSLQVGTHTSYLPEHPTLSPVERA